MAASVCEKMKLENLALDIRAINNSLQESVAKAINKHVTARNWLIGYCIVNYEQHGDDRAKYGEKILQNLAREINDGGLSYTNLKLYRQFYVTFPELGFPVCDYLAHVESIGQLLIGQLQNSEIKKIIISQQAIGQLPGEEWMVPADRLFERLSYTHFVQLLPIKDSLERAFYETECIHGVWSTTELKRQIGTNLFARTGLSKNMDKAIVLANKGAEKISIKDVIRSPYTFEFLGLKPKDVMKEKPLEDALAEHLKEFLLELGHGFCFEDRQRRILIDGEYHYYDLLFYNRLLHCGFIIDLKSHPFDYADAAQMNMYLNYYKKNFMAEGDNPPVGLLLCTGVGMEKAEYATMGMDRNLFISEYRVALPSREQMTDFLKKENRGRAPELA